MSKEEYVDRAGLFAYDRLSCLRNEYAFNDCTKCIEICPEDAFVFVRKKLRLDSDKCNSCGVCTGSCPSNSLFLVGDTLPIKKIQNEDEPLLSCENQKSCLAKYRGFDYITMALEAKKSFTCNTSTCKECDLNIDGKIKEFITNSISEANIVLEKVSSYSIKSSESGADPQKELLSSRRAFFRSFGKGVEDEIGLHVKSLDRVKKTLKENLLHVEDSLVKDELSFVSHKSIDKSCTNCGECVEFCPTTALSYSSDKRKILFQMGKCIGCGICEDICKSNSITGKQEKLDLVNFAFDKMEILVEHELKVCKVCKCSFSYHGGDEICDRCESFEKEHSDMFLLASDRI